MKFGDGLDLTQRRKQVYRKHVYQLVLPIRFVPKADPSLFFGLRPGFFDLQLMDSFSQANQLLVLAADESCIGQKLCVLFIYLANLVSKKES